MDRLTSPLVDSESKGLIEADNSRPGQGCSSLHTSETADPV